MLSRNSYPQAYVDASRAAVRTHLDAWEALGLTPEARAGFEAGYVRQLLLALDGYFIHRGRGQEGKDGNPLNEVRMLCTGIMENKGRMSVDKTIRYKPELSVLKFQLGDEIRLNADDFARLSAAFFDEIEKKFA